MARIIIIGNGFDLAHGLKTSYNDFLRFIIYQEIGNHLLYEELLSLNYAPSNVDDFFMRKEEYLSKKIKNKLFSSFLNQMQSGNWCDIEEIFFDFLSITVGEDSLKELNTELNAIKKHLEVYLKSEQKKMKTLYQYNKFFEALDAPETLIVNFNYTNTLDKYNISKSHIINIHGEIDSKENPTIFGYAATQKDMIQIPLKKGNEIYRNIKRMNYANTGNYKKLLDFLDFFDITEIMILGHSLGSSDKLILKDIFSKVKKFGIHIFYYKEQEDHFQKVCNIDRIVEEENSQNLVLPFPNSQKMPQFNDSPSDEEQFLNYVRKL